MTNFKGRDFLKLLDYTPEEIAELLALAAELKAKKKAGISHRLCEGKNVALIFEKTSTRTRCAFEVAAHDLGARKRRRECLAALAILFYDLGGDAALFKQIGQIIADAPAADDDRVLRLVLDDL